MRGEEGQLMPPTVEGFRPAVQKDDERGIGTSSSLPPSRRIRMTWTSYRPRCYDAVCDPIRFNAGEDHTEILWRAAVKEELPQATIRSNNWRRQALVVYALSPPPALAGYDIFFRKHKILPPDAGRTEVTRISTRRANSHNTKLQNAKPVHRPGRR